ncbi:heavy-metal-associated domain-containing protein [Niastella caeni]|uniref:Heavy-metal-associated domain-containing protein n=1 Tax=Niastella caeni TaxID=2569763 RepID=A0A4S8H726_9BACT|nr:heavy-metal-associated domain-containing protein [Niastella caeni]THU30367.1 heavy-metal-associated domain-containing protein [Niastella caeni]
METLKFKTTIKCSGCVANVTPFLNKTAGEDNWNVDTQSPDKVLTISSGDKVNETEVIKSIQEAGYKAEKIS